MKCEVCRCSGAKIELCAGCEARLSPETRCAMGLEWRLHARVRWCVRDLELVVAVREALEREGCSQAQVAALEEMRSQATDALRCARALRERLDPYGDRPMLGVATREVWCHATAADRAAVSAFLRAHEGAA